MKTISDVMTRDTCLVTPEQTIAEVAVLMREKDVGSVLVQENGKLIGIVTDRDLAVRAVATARGSGTAVREIMTDGVKYCFEDDAARDVASGMARLGVRRLPVLDRGDRLVGFVSLSNMLLAQDPCAPVMNISLTEVPYSGTALMESVCHPHPSPAPQTASGEATIRVWLQPGGSPDAASRQRNHHAAM